MDNKEYFLGAGAPTPAMPTWQTLPEQSSDCYLNSNWEKKSTDHYPHFDSALSSMVSSPAPSNPAMSSDSFAVRELIGKLSTICNSGEIPAPLHQNSMQISNMDLLVRENLANLGNTMPLHPTLHSLSADPGFVERAAKFSCFGTRSFNGRTAQIGLSNVELPYRSPPLPRVSSSPSLRADGSPLRNRVPAQSQMEMSSVNGSLSASPMGKIVRAGSDRTELANSNESSVSEQNPIGENGQKTLNETNSRKRKSISRGKAKEIETSQSPISTKVGEADDHSNSKRSKLNKKENDDPKTEEETKANTKTPEPPKDYIHVRARRGQATDSHSLAERVRREKISERMKLLQDLVPGCNKVTGKALMLDEIINYVQSLQHQVEFLSMKLSSVNPRLDFDIQNLTSKEGFQPNGSLLQPGLRLGSSGSVLYGNNPTHQSQQQVHTNVSNGAMMDSLENTLFRSIGLNLPPIDENGQAFPQLPMFCEDDLQSVVMGFGQNPTREIEFDPQSFPGSNQTCHMKIEL